MKLSEMKMNSSASPEEVFSSAAVASAVRPGVVIGQPDDGLVNFVSDLDSLARGEVAGFNARVTGSYRQLFPRLSKLDYERVQYTKLPEVPGALEGIVGSVKGLSEEERAAYVAARKVVVQTMDDGSRRLIVVPRVPSAKTEVELRKDEGFMEMYEPVPSVSQESLAARPKKRSYTLAQLLTDLDVLPKFNLSMRSVETAKRLAASDHAAAALLFQSLMNAGQDEICVTVTASDYSKNRVQAKNTIRQMCRHANRMDAAVTTVVIMDKFTMLGPGGEYDWCVSGPLKYATEVSYVYWLVRSEGCINPSVLLSMELVLLGIDIHDGHSAQEPELVYHASMPGDLALPSGVPVETAAELSVEGRMALTSLATRLLPVLASDETPLATAVRVTGRYVLINSHVVDTDKGCTIAGERVVVKSQLSRDLWCAKSDGDAEPWLLRTPEVGELVVVCYVQNGEFGCSQPLKITSVDDKCVVTTLDSSVTFGASGGALVALKDYALLGVHSAATQTNLLSYRFGEQEFADLLDADSVTSFSRYSDVGSFAEKTVRHFKEKGLWSVFSSAVESIEPVYVESAHVGMAVRNGAHSYTTCDAELALRLGKEHRVCKFETVATGGFFRTSNVVGHSSPVFRRTPNYFEKVFVLGRDGDDVYITAETTVRHVSPNSRKFVIGDLPALDKPVTGGIVMARDGAVLGCCGNRSMATAVGLGYDCWPLIREEHVQATDPRALVAAAFPFLNVSAWPDSLLDEVFIHASVGKYPNSSLLFNAGPKPLANIGDNIAKAELYKSLREHGVPHSQWAGLFELHQSNAIGAEAAWKHKFAQGMVVGPGVTLPKSAKAYADLTEALIGAASLVERSDVVALLCKSLGLLFTPPEERVSMSRSISEY